MIKELEPDRMRKSGLLVPAGTHDLPPNEGIVLAIGDGPPDLPDFKMPVKPGDHVVFPRSAGVWVEVEAELRSGPIRRFEGPYSPYEAEWDWRNFGKLGRKVDGGFAICGRILRFRTRKPRGMEVLERIVADVPAPRIREDA